MRLFISVNFDEAVKSKLVDTQEKLKRFTYQGNFTRKENFHVTLIFLGEIEKNKVSEIKKAMDRVSFEPFNIDIRDIGNFKRDGGDIWWIGIEESKSLKAVYNQLYDGLSQMGFELEKRKFTPHLTLAREVEVKKELNKDEFSGSIKNITFKVTKINLMKSERIAGKLTYTSIYER